MAILIKRYANRKLYNTQASRYITLKGIAELIDNGEQVRVIDNETGEDITSVALSQILVDSERSNSDVSGNVLSQILGRGGDALYDTLRKSFDDASENLGDFQDRFRRFGHPGSVIVIDLDRLKVINDTQGHQAGDDYIRRAGQTLKDCLSREDYIARLGG